VSTWNINPNEVGGVLSATAVHIGEEGGSEGLVGHMAEIEDSVTGISTAADSTPVSIALGEFAGHYFGVMGEMVGLTISAITGASDATTAYVNGNHEMALEAQANAGVIPEPEQPSHPGDPNVRL
jgi:hypothetical protein